MKKGSISIYYNSEWGYLVVSDATLYDSVMRVTIPPVMTENNNATEICLGKMALEALKRSRNAMPVMEEEIADFNFWQVSGIKGFSAFRKRFQCVEVKEQETGYHVEQLIRERNGSYVWDESADGINLNLDCTEEQMGRAIYQIFHEEILPDDGRSDIVSFETVNHQTIQFVHPPDQFQDVGDGNTDAYQIYTYQDDEKTYIAFLIDNGYAQVNQQGILKRWKQMYGNVQDFHFVKNTDGVIKYVATAKTQETIIKSYFCKDGDGWLEILLEINNQFSIEHKTQIIEYMEEMIKTIKIE